jgi:mRNA-degrading endonuclease toxin of MazEF toxin-antitoxin module
VYIPSRGDVIWLDFDRQVGYEQAGCRPAFVVSPLKYNQKSNLALICPITSKIKGWKFEVLLFDMKTMGVILSDQLKSLDWKARGVEFIEQAPDAVVEEVLAKLESLVNEAEFSLMVSDAFQRQGLGTEVLRQPIQVGRDERLERITADILPENEAMQRVAEKVGFSLQRESGLIKAEIVLNLPNLGH